MNISHCKQALITFINTEVVYNIDIFSIFTCTTGGAPFSEVDCSELCTVVFVQTLLGSCPDCDKVDVIVDDMNSFFMDVVEECVTDDDILVST